MMTRKVITVTNPSVYGTSFPSVWGNGGGGDLRAAGAGCVANGASTWVAFAFGGIVAMFSGYAMRAWGRAIPAMAVLSTSFVRIRQRRLFAGTLVIVPVDAGVSIAMVARAFGAYAVQFLHEAARRSTLYCSTRWGSLR